MSYRWAWTVTVLFGIVAACGGSDSSDDSAGGDSDGGSDGTIRDGSARDASDDANGDAAPVFTPAALGSRLVLWLDAAQGISLEDAGRDAEAVHTWSDQSGNGNDAIQDAAARAPFFLPSTSDASVNGRPLVVFQGSQFIFVPESPSLVWGTGDFALYVVLRYKNLDTTFALAVGKYDSTDPLFAGPNLFANYYAPVQGSEIVGRLDHDHFASTLDAGYNDDKMHIAGMRRAGSTVEIRVDGVSASNGDAGLPDGSPIDVSAPGFPVMIGNRTQLDAPLDGDIAEIIGVKGSLTPSEVDEIESYLRSKYAL